MAETETDNVTPLPIKLRPKDTTNTLRQRRHRANRKGKDAPQRRTVPVVAETTPVMVLEDAALAVTPKNKNHNEIKGDVTVGRDHAQANAAKNDVPPRRTSWSLVTLAYGFFGLGIAINICNAWSAGNWADTAVPAAMGVLAEGVVFFLPARAMALRAGRRALAFALLLFVSASP